MASTRQRKLVLLLIISCFFIHSIVSNDFDISNEQHIHFINSLSSISTSIMIPIRLLHSEWIISTPSISSTMNLKSFINALTIYHLNPETVNIQLQIIETPQSLNKHINELYDLCQIINESDIYISNLMISEKIPQQILQIISIQNISITFYLQPPSPSHRQLLSNSTLNITQYNMIEKESWICKPWPIYLGFFAGIGVTLLVTMAISLTMAENDDEINNALEKVITAGIEMSVKNNNNMDGAIEIVGGPGRHKRYRTNSALLLFKTNQTSSPKSRSRSVVLVRKGSINNINNNNNNNHKRMSRSRSVEPSWANDLNLSFKKQQSMNDTHLSIQRLKYSIDEESQTDIDNEMESNGDKEREQQQEHEQENTLRIESKLGDNINYLQSEIQITPQITPQSDNSRDIYISSDNAINGQRHSEEMSISSLTKQRSKDSESDQSLYSAKDEKKEEYMACNVSDGDEEEYDENKVEIKAENINLSPIHDKVENNVNLNKFKKHSHGYYIRHNGPEYVKRFNGKRIRVGFKCVPNPVNPILDHNNNDNDGDLDDDDDDDDESGIYSDNSDLDEVP